MYNEQEQDQLLRLDSSENQDKRRKFVIRNRPKKFASNRRTGKLTKSLLCLDEDGLSSWCTSIPDGKMARCLPPEYRNSRKIRELIEVKKLSVPRSYVSNLIFL